VRVRIFLIVLVVVNLVLITLSQSSMMTSGGTGQAPNTALPSFALVSELPPPEPACYRIGPWQGLAMKRALIDWFTAQGLAFDEHLLGAETPTYEVWVEAAKKHTADIKDRLAQALMPVLTTQERANQVRFLVGRVATQSDADALSKKLSMRLFKPIVERPKWMAQSGYFEIKIPKDQARPDVSLTVAPFAQGDKVTVESCPESTAPALPEPGRDPNSPGAEPVKGRAATA